MQRRLSLAACVCALAACANPDQSADPSASFAQHADALTTAPQLVKDLRATSPALSSYPGPFVTAGGVTYFLAKTPATGSELWRTDGTAAGTRMVKEITPGSDDTYIQSLTAVGNTLYFVANEATTGSELWKTDGTEAGTQLVKDIRPGTLGFGASALTAIGNTLYFAAEDGASGTELWKSDGTAQGTVRVKDLNPGSASGNPSGFVSFGGTILFRATDGVHGVELWKTDGTEAGTQLVKDINTAGTGDSQPDQFTVLGNQLLFVAGDAATGRELWTTDGTAQGTVLLKDLNAGANSSQPSSLTLVNGAVYFGADDGASGRELWKTDGTPAGTVLVKDVMPGATGSYLQSFVAVGNSLFFSAIGGDPSRTPPTSYGNEVWTSDGTEAGTHLVKDLWLGTGNSDPNQMVALNGALYFVAETGSGDRQLYKSDGSAAGTVVVKQISAHPAINVVTSTNGRLFLSADDATHGSEPWTSDGTSAGTQLLADLAQGGTGGEPRDFTAVGNTVYFTADDGVVGRELWKSDGSAQGTVLVKDVTAGTYGVGPALLTALNGKLYFNSGYAELWVSDGSAAGTQLVKNVNPNFGIDRLDRLVALNGRLFFAATDGTHGIEAWTSDGTAAGTVMLKDVVTGSNGSNPGSFAALGADTYFFAFGFGSAGQLYKTDGTPAGTVKMVDVHTRDIYARPWNLTTFGSEMLFTAGSENATGFEVWATDGTQANTRMLARIESGGILRVFGGPFTVAGSTAFFVADDSVHGSELWATDGTSAGTRMVKDILPGTLPSGISQLTALGNRVYFLANDGLGGRELWTSDGSVNGTVRVIDQLPGWPSGAINTPLFAFPPTGPLLFAGADATHGAETWQIDPVGSAPALLADLAPGLRSSNPRGFTRAGAFAYFSADDGVHDRELWAVRLPVTVDTTPPAITCPSAQTVEAASASGAPATYAAAHATDDSGIAPALSYAPASGTTLPLGATTVRVTATDDAGNHADCTFVVTVSDTRAPRITCPADKAAEATGPTGAPVTWSAATATDEVTATPAITYSKPSGSTFALGATQLTATAADAAGNRAECTFTITVRDTTAPQVRCPDALTKEAEDASGAHVTFTAPTATDLVSAAPAIALDHASGSLFPVGATTVHATATDAAGNAGKCQFVVTVTPRKDRVAPQISCPGDQGAEATGPDGAVVRFPAATATDDVTAQPTVRYDHAPGSRFPLGLTRVTATATDAANNSASCDFRVSVTDTTAPTLNCPANQTADAVDAAGAPVSFDAPTAFDKVTRAPAITLDHESGSVFPAGDTQVTATATDAANNAAHCSFTVHVNPLPQKPDEPVRETPAGCGCNAVSDVGALALVGLAFARRRRLV